MGYMGRHTNQDPRRNQRTLWRGLQSMVVVEICNQTQRSRQDLARQGTQCRVLPSARNAGLKERIVKQSSRLTISCSDACTNKLNRYQNPIPSCLYSMYPAYRWFFWELPSCDQKICRPAAFLLSAAEVVSALRAGALYLVTLFAR